MTKGEKYIKETSKHLFKINDQFYKKIFIATYENIEYAIVIEFKEGYCRDIRIHETSKYNNVSINNKNYVEQYYKTLLFKQYEKNVSIKHFKHIKEFLNKIELFLRENADVPNTNYRTQDTFKINLHNLIKTYTEKKDL